MAATAPAGATPPTEDKRKAFEMAKQEMEYRVELFGKFKDGDLNVGENSCIDRCSAKYWQASESEEGE